MLLMLNVISGAKHIVGDEAAGTGPILSKQALSKQGYSRAGDCTAAMRD